MRQAERSPLLAACERGHTEIALILIDKGADVSMVDKVRIHIATARLITTGAVI